MKKTQVPGIQGKTNNKKIDSKNRFLSYKERTKHIIFSIIQIIWIDKLKFKNISIVLKSIDV